MTSSYSSEPYPVPAEGLKVMVEQILARMGVEGAAVEVKNNSAVEITLETAVFFQYRRLLKSWFDVSQQDDHWTILNERKRGTGYTSH